MARSTLACLETGRGLAPCASCGACKAVCRNDVNIGAGISRLVSSRQQFAVERGLDLRSCGECALGRASGHNRGPRR
jgi:succinate dehydrogenase/fumarate reductase-like Fe-S protein